MEQMKQKTIEDDITMKSKINKRNTKIKTFGLLFSKKRAEFWR